jgi:hypothetical protein
VPATVPSHTSDAMAWPQCGVRHRQRGDRPLAERQGGEVVSSVQVAIEALQFAAIDIVP